VTGQHDQNGVTGCHVMTGDWLLKHSTRIIQASGERQLSGT
jgi:hypothetical protein